MSDTAHSARGGEFATSPRARVAENYDYICAKLSAGVPIQHIARMTGCSMADVQSLASVPPFDAMERPPAPSRNARAPNGLKAIRVRADHKEKPRTEQWRVIRAARLRPMPTRVRAVVQAIANRRGVLMSDLLGGRALKGLSAARNEVFHTLYLTGQYSMPLIGSYIGGRDHTTVLNGIRNHAATIAPDLAAWNALGASEAA